MKNKNICVVTGSRAEYGLLFQTLKKNPEVIEIKFKFNCHWNASIKKIWQYL